MESLWTARRVHVQRSIEGEKRRRAMLLFDALGRRERKKNISLHGTWLMHNRTFCKSTTIGSRPTYNPSRIQFSQDTDYTARFKNQVKLVNSS